MIAQASVAALVARTMTYPLDTLKTLSQYGKKPSLNAPLFRGLGIALVLSVPANALYLVTYHKLKDLFSKRQSLECHAISAATAELVSGTLWTPMEIIKSKLQVGQQIGKSSMQHVSSIYQTQGLRGFYTGYLLSQAVFIPYTVTYFVLYERLKQWVEPSFVNFLLASSLSAGFAGALTNILDMVKTRLQVDSSRSAIEIMKRIYHKEGIKGFSRGLLPRVLWITPSMSISMAVFDTLKNA